MIFRKVSDVLKEQELAERRKNDPVLNHSQDHLVRKLFNKFKKGPDGGAPTTSVVGPGTSDSKASSSQPPSSAHNLDVEMGEGLPKTEVTPPTEPEPAPAPKAIKGWGRLRGDKPSAPPPPPAKVETVVQPFTAAASSADATAAVVEKSAGSSNNEYQAINDRLNRIEQLISDLMIKVDDKTRSIEKSVAKVKSSKSKHEKPRNVTLCVDSSSAAAPSSSGCDGTRASPNNCDEQFL